MRPSLKLLEALCLEHDATWGEVAWRVISALVGAALFYLVIFAMLFLGETP